MVQKVKAQVDEEGRLVLPPEIISRYGLKPGAEVLLDEYVTFRKKVQEFEFSPCTICGGCHLFEKNEEDCFGNPFPTCGGCLWAQGIIQCP